MNLPKIRLEATCSRSGLLALLFSAAFLLPSGSARAADPPALQRPALQRPTLRWTERLAGINPVPGPINLRGDRGESELYFNLSTRVDPVTASLHLELSNSQALLANRSQLVIRLNDVVVAQLPLKPNAPISLVDIALPVELLKGGGNRLNFFAAQHYTNECEAPGAAELWSQIDTSRSRIDISGRALETAPVLSELQELIGPGLFGGRRFTLMAASGAEGPSDATIAAGAILSEALALRLQYQPASIDFVTATSDGGTAPTLRLAAPPPNSTTVGATTINSESDILLFGTLDELRPVLGPEVAAGVTNGFLGVYALPSDRRRLVIVVSGRTADEVSRAAGAFGIANFPFVDAPQQTVDRLELRPGNTFFPHNVLKEGTTTSFAELGLKTTTLRGTTARAGIDVILPPDLYLPDSAEAELSLDYSYGAGMRSDAVMNVLINGQFQQAIGLADGGGAVLRGYKIRLPGRKLLPGKNRIDFELVMTPSYAGACVPPETRNLIMSLADSSTISVAKGARVASQPDLQLFAATGFPYIDGPSFDLALASRDPATVAAGWTVLARLSQVAGRILPEARIVVGAPAANRHAIVVGAAPDLGTTLSAGAPVGVQSAGSLPYETTVPLPVATPSLLTSLREWAGWAPQGWDAAAAPSRVSGTGAMGRNGLLMAARAPGGGTFTLTTLTAASREALWSATQSLVGPLVWTKLEEDVTLWRPAASLRQPGPGDAQAPEAVFTQRIGPAYYIGSFGTLYAARYFIAAYPAVWIAVTIVALLLLVAMLRLFLVARRRRVHPGSNEGVP